MTAINAMQFGNNSGGMVADSQSSTRLRKYDTSEKVGTLQSANGTRALIGGTGTSFLLYEAQTRLQKQFPKEKEFGLRELAEGLAGILTEIGRDVIDAEMKGRFGFGANEYIAGRLNNGTPIGQHLLSPAGEVYLGRDPDIRQTKNNEFLVVGADSAGNGLYLVPMGERPFLSSFAYGSAGSGQDESDKALHDFVRRLPRADRHTIDKIDGMTALVRATNRSSELNQGVGGIPTVAYFDEAGVSVLDEDRSLLSTEIVKAGDAALLTSADVRRALSKLIFEKEDSRDVEKEVFLDKNNVAEIMRFLRGYRVVQS